MTRLLESEKGAGAAQPDETELGSGFDARLTQSLKSRDLRASDPTQQLTSTQQLYAQQSEQREQVLVHVRPMSAEASRQPTKAARSLGPSRPQSAWASLRHGEQPKAVGGLLGLREKHDAMRGMAQLRESAVAGGAQQMLDSLERHDRDGSGALGYQDFATAVCPVCRLGGPQLATPASWGWHGWLWVALLHPGETAAPLRA